MAHLGRREFVVIGAGVVGASIAWGLARAGARPLVLDEGDLSPRASRANNALVWVQGKGRGLGDYALWSLASAGLWPSLAAELKLETGIDVALSQRGGFEFFLTEAELDQGTRGLEAIARDTGGRAAPYEVLHGRDSRARLPGLGAAVAGTTFCPADGHVNALRLFHALHVAMAARGCDYRAGHGVDTVAPGPAGFRITGAWGEVEAEKVVLAAGLGNERLAPMVGLHSPLKRSKGQILVTEKCAPFFPYTSLLVLQSSEGGILIGASHDPSIDSHLTSGPVNTVLAQRAVLAFPRLAALNVVRSWAGFRIKTPDEFPVYEQSPGAPGAFVATCHSGVTLAANHALVLAPQILAGRLDPGLSPFSARRFHVPQDH